MFSSPAGTGCAAAEQAKPASNNRTIYLVKMSTNDPFLVSMRKIRAIFIYNTKVVNDDNVQSRIY